MIERSGATKTAPKTLGSPAHPVLDDAPGNYVLAEARAGDPRTARSVPEA